ncbi:hypothetical protein GTV32_19575 [Gordonia sp. SID5947]|uniref:hypothetical protein n=1 Tax=Gordonia sp. SID5947 TaxID=2690315 RepID=UPI00136DD857|nr:hypothetical protein [Gordonia sp. SID5947]MYR08364.1 hypothetical protein [Gordonia sp. SID5947]
MNRGIAVSHTGRLAVAIVAVIGALIGGVSLAAPAQASTVTRYLDLPLTNRFADQYGGGVNRALPTDLTELSRLVRDARASGVDPKRYAALLFQYRLVQATTGAGIDLAGWDPAKGFHATRSTMIKGYRYYENFQIAHRNLQWAGMAGMVGADFGGGTADVVLAGDIYGIRGLQPLAAQIIEKATQVAGPGIIGQFPEGLRNLAYHADQITPADLAWFSRQILVMQKAIFSDLMPMHVAFVKDGLDGIEEFRRAGIVDDAVAAAWRDIASDNPARVSKGNGTLLRREQYDVVGWQFDNVRNYRRSAGVGSALTYAMTLAGSPSVAGVPALRDFISYTYRGRTPDGRTLSIATPIPDWDWSEFDLRWKYVTTELLPRYRDMVDNRYGQLVAQLKVPYETQFESHRPIYNLHQILGDAVAHTKVSIS